jgi:hypothetical protein
MVGGPSETSADTFPVLLLTTNVVESKFPVGFTVINVNPRKDVTMD